MPHRLLAFLCAAYTITAVAAADAPPVFIEMENPSFETLDPETGLPAAWHNNTRAVLVSDDIIARDGDRSLEIVFFGALQDVFCSASVVPEDKTATYRVTVDVRMQEYDGWVGLTAYRYPAPFKAKFETRLNPDKAPDAWQQVTLDVPPKEAMSSISIFLTARGTWGRVWFDHVRVQKLEEDR